MSLAQRYSCFCILFKVAYSNCRIGNERKNLHIFSQMGNYSNDIRCMNLCMGLVKHVPHSRQKMVPLMVSNLYYSPTKGPYFLNEPYQRSLFFKRALPKVRKYQYISALPKVNFSGPSLSITRKAGRVPPRETL